MSVSFGSAPRQDLRGAEPIVHGAVAAVTNAWAGPVIASLRSQ
jgi:hypothetical protein